MYYVVYSWSKIFPVANFRNPICPPQRIWEPNVFEPLALLRPSKAADSLLALCWVGFREHWLCDTCLYRCHTRIRTVCHTAVYDVLLQRRKLDVRDICEGAWDHWDPLDVRWPGVLPPIRWSLWSASKRHPRVVIINIINITINIILHHYTSRDISQVWTEGSQDNWTGNIFLPGMRLRHQGCHRSEISHQGNQTPSKGVAEDEG